MAGGNFDINVGKVRPGTYVNVKSSKTQKSKGSERGIAVVPLIGYDWGPDGEFIRLSVDSPDASAVLLGRSVYDDNDNMLLVREIFKNAVTCYVYVINAGTAAKAVTEDGISVQAVYPGTRGNDIKVVSTESVEGGCSVAVYLGTEKVEFYEGIRTVGGLLSAASGKYVKFSCESPEKEMKAFAALSLTGGTAGDVENSAVTKFLDELEKIRFNTLCFPVTETTLQAVCIAKMKMLRDSVGKYVQAVLPDCAADYEGIINVTNAVSLDGRELTKAQTCAWVTGATAGASKTQSLTYLEYEGATGIVGAKTSDEAVEAVRNGEFFFSRSEEDKIVAEYDINSLHNFTTERTPDYAKNRVIRVYDSFAEDLRKNFPPNKFDNDNDGWLIMEGLGRGLLQQYADDGAITNVDLATDFYVDKSRSHGDDTFFNVGLQAVDSAEKMYFSVSTR